MKPSARKQVLEVERGSAEGDVRLRLYQCGEPDVELAMVTVELDRARAEDVLEDLCRILGKRPPR